MKPYGVVKRDSRICPYGCCHGTKAASKFINVRCSTDGARGKNFKSGASRHGRGAARQQARRDIANARNESFLAAEE